MRNLLTIGELAKLMNVSTHQIRYFEEKGILNPHVIDDNGYRLYSITEVYTLSHILLLRKFDIPVADIKMCFDNYKSDDYVALLNSKKADLDYQIQELTKLRDFTSEVVKKMNNVDGSLNTYTIKTVEKRCLQHVFTMDYKESLSIKEFYNQLVHNFNLYEIDIIGLYDMHTAQMYIEVDCNSSNISCNLSSGKYLCYTFLTDNDDDFRNAIDDFLEYAKKNKITLSGKVLVAENSILSTCFNNTIHYEIQCLIDET